MATPRSFNEWPTAGAGSCVVSTQRPHMTSSQLTNEIMEYTPPNKVTDKYPQGMKRILYTIMGLTAASMMTSCRPDSNNNQAPKPDTKLPEWYYAGGELGTTPLSTSNAYEQPTKAVEEAGLYTSFKRGEALFEKPFMSNLSGVRAGLGPVYVRNSCVHCHPNYGHGTRIKEGPFRTNEIGNGCLLVVYTPDDQKYVTWLAPMPQSGAVAPFKSPVDETKIHVAWQKYTDEWGNKFADGETYDLQYPVVSMPPEAVYVVQQGYTIPKPYDVILESTIGIYGTGLLDAISDEDLLAEHQKQEKYGVRLNPAIFKDGAWSNMYQGLNKQKYARRYTYAMSRGPLQDGPGANAIWNITNVTRSDRRYHFLDRAGTYAEYSSKDPEVQAGFDEYIAKVDPSKEHPEWWEGDIEQRIKSYLLSRELPTEMSDEDFTDLMVWHRGLAVPAVRGVHDEDVVRGKQLFEQIGCATCHKPSWTTGKDEVMDPNDFAYTRQLPRYPNQKIWPYTDMVQHRLEMVNNIRTGWCRTTPLWGRGLHQKITGSPTADRLHDTRARNVIEAIMWHGAPQSDARKTVEAFRALSKQDRDAVVKFIDAI